MQDKVRGDNPPIGRPVNFKQTIRSHKAFALLLGYMAKRFESYPVPSLSELIRESLCYAASNPARLKIRIIKRRQQQAEQADSI